MGHGCWMLEGGAERWFKRWNQFGWVDSSPLLYPGIFWTTRTASQSIICFQSRADQQFPGQPSPCQAGFLLNQLRFWCLVPKSVLLVKRTFFSGHGEDPHPSVYSCMNQEPICICLSFIYFFLKTPGNPSELHPSLTRCFPQSSVAGKATAEISKTTFGA